MQVQTQWIEAPVCDHWQFNWFILTYKICTLISMCFMTCKHFKRNWDTDRDCRSSCFSLNLAYGIFTIFLSLAMCKLTHWDALDEGLLSVPVICQGVFPCKHNCCHRKAFVIGGNRFWLIMCSCCWFKAPLLDMSARANDKLNVANWKNLNEYRLHWCNIWLTLNGPIYFCVCEF